METNDISYERRLVAFIDILGFKDIVRQSERDSKKVQVLYSALTYLKDWEASKKWDLKYVEIEEDAQKKGVENFDIRGKTNSTSFSDSIVVSVRVDNNVNEMASTLIVNLAYIGAILMEEGILFRGALTIGNIVHRDNGMVFGQGLIDAYLLESKSAKYPRVILSKKLLAELNYPIEQKQFRFPYHQYISRFEDGCVGFHQMIYYQVVDSWVEMTKERMYTSLGNIRKTIIAGLDSSMESPEIFEKYRWLKDQYNELIILSDYNIDDETHENVKLKIRKINEDISGHNIHYSITDNFYEIRKKKDEK
jgi:hypothetical protein